MSDYFHNARDFKIPGGNFSHVGRDQTNIRTIKHAVFHVEGTSQAKEVDVESETLELSEFHEVKRGDIRIIKEIARHKAQDRRNSGWFNPYRHLDRQKEEETGDCDHIIYAAELNVIGPPVQGSKFTVKTYHGPYALENWREEFSRCSQVVCESFVIFDWRSVVFIVQQANGGFRLQPLKNSISDNNGRGSEELVPAAHVLDNDSGAGGRVLKEFYIDELLRYLGDCEPNEVWIDPSRGVLCRGPAGPECEVGRWVEGFKDLPSDVGFLKEDVFIRFAASIKSREIDELLVGRLGNKYRKEVSTHQVDRPTVITPSNTPIAFGVQCWCAFDGRAYDGLVGRTELENGAMRSTMKEWAEQIDLFSLDPYQGQAWLAQAFSVLQSCGISANDDLSQYKLIIPNCELRGRLSKPQERRPKPIYLFILPSTALASCTTGDVHYWSLDPDGLSCLSPDTCHLFGLPTELELTVRHTVYSWPSDVYGLIRKYQVSRGFDPRTPDFARSLKYPIYQPARDDSNRFNDIRQDAKASSLWTTIKSLFSPTVSDDSDILTVGF